MLFTVQYYASSAVLSVVAVDCVHCSFKTAKHIINENEKFHYTVLCVYVCVRMARICVFFA